MEFARRAKPLRVILIATALGLAACTQALSPNVSGTAAASYDRIDKRLEINGIQPRRDGGAPGHFVSSNGRRVPSTQALACVPDVEARNNTLGNALATQLRSPILSQNYVWTMQEHFENRRYRDAERLAAISLSLREKVLGRNDLSVAQGLNTLGLTYDAQGRHADAEALYVQALQIQEEVLGKFHTLVASTVENLASVYVAECRYSDARALHQRALEVRESVQGPGHPDVAKSLASYFEFEKQIAAIDAGE